jgi:histidine triad (HIT) family protein
MYDPSNIFAKILRNEIPCTKIYEDEFVLAFPDINPKAPIHILVIPKGAYTCLDDFGSRASPAEITGFFKAVAHITDKMDLQNRGYRMIANKGLNGGQEVPHFHVHLLGGKALGPMVSKG